LFNKPEVPTRDATQFVMNNCFVGTVTPVEWLDIVAYWYAGSASTMHWGRSPKPSGKNKAKCGAVSTVPCSVLKYMFKKFRDEPAPKIDGVNVDWDSLPSTGTFFW
jgi:hypothetical protein